MNENAVVLQSKGRRKAIHKCCVDFGSLNGYAVYYRKNNTIYFNTNFVGNIKIVVVKMG